MSKEVFLNAATHGQKPLSPRATDPLLKAGFAELEAQDREEFELMRQKLLASLTPQDHIEALARRSMEQGDLPIKQIEAAIIKTALVLYPQDMSAIARKLKIGRSTLYRKIGEFIGPDTPKL